MSDDKHRWRRPDALGRTRMEALRQRHLIKRAVRDYLHGEGFLEIDVPLLVRGTTPDAEVESFSVTDGWYLSTSAEYQIKRMEIGGFDRIYTLTQNFRRGDAGRYRNPEFTMLEWARVGASLVEIEQDMEQIVWLAHQSLGGRGDLAYQGRSVDIKPPFARMSVKEAVRQATGAALEDFSAPCFARAIRAAGIGVHDMEGKDAPVLFSLLMDFVQERIGFDRPVFVQEWPSFQTSSAVAGAMDNCVERSELFIAGVELSDGFPSLCGADRQRKAFQEQQERRKILGKSLVVLDQAYLAAMEAGMPQGAGMAMGFDRLVMVLTDRADIASVLAFGEGEL